VLPGSMFVDFPSILPSVVERPDTAPPSAPGNSGAGSPLRCGPCACVQVCECAALQRYADCLHLGLTNCPGGESQQPRPPRRASLRRHWATHQSRLELQLPTWTQMEASGKCPCKAGEAACRAGAHQHPFPGPLQHLRMEACPPIRSSWQKELQQWKLRAVLRRCRS
jgi:hypothetical protein